MKSLEFNEMKFILSDDGRETVFRPMTMYLMGEATQFNLIHQADDSSYFIISNSFFEDEQTGLALSNEQSETRFNNFRRSIESKFDLNFNGRSKGKSEVRIIGNQALRASLLDITFVEISDEQYILWSKACKKNEPNTNKWGANSNQFPNTGHCSITLSSGSNGFGDFAHIAAYIPTRIFSTMWSEIQSKNISSVSADFRFWYFTDQSQYAESSSSSSFTYYLPPQPGGYGAENTFNFDSSGTIGGELTSLTFSQKLGK